jgi:hypothetical protein
VVFAVMVVARDFEQFEKAIRYLHKNLLESKPPEILWCPPNPLIIKAVSALGIKVMFDKA